MTHEFGLVTTDLLSIRGPYKINRSVANPVAKVEPLDPSETRLSLKVARSADLHGQCLDVGQAFQNLSNFAKDLAPLFGSGQATFTPAAEANSLVLTFDPKGLYCEYRLIAESKCPSFQAVQTRLDKIEAVLDRISLQKFDLN